MKRFSLLSALLFLPIVAGAQQTIQTFGRDLMVFINYSIIPFLFAIALVIFIYYMVRYFIIDINDATGKERARDYAVYSIFAFVLMVSVWGIVNLVISGTGLGREQAVCPDVSSFFGGDCADVGSGSRGGGTGSSGTGAGGGAGGGDAGGGDGGDGGTSGPIEQQLEESVDTATVQVINEINESELATNDPTTADSLIAVLSDESITDETKLDVIKRAYSELGAISYETADAYRNAVNQLRTYNGEPHIFIDLAEEPLP